MPRAVFFLLWQTIQKGEEFFGYVKNMRKDGGFYWVYANVTERFSDHHNTGYYSVRRKPSQQAIDVVTPIYAEMLATEKKVGTRDGIQASCEILNSKLIQLGTTYEEFSRDY